MGGGLLQLVAYGAQDIYLTGNPQVTFFKVVYRRHTNFALESIEQTFNGSVGFNKRVTTQISRNGDLIHRMYLQVTLPKIADAATTQWVDYIGLRLIKDVEIEIGGQKIDKQYSDFMYIWNELSLPYGKKNGYDTMVGANLAAASDATTLYVPLEFWFCRNVGLALPLIALQYHEVKINLQFEDKPNLVKNGATPPAAGILTDVPGELAATLWVDYVFLDTDERRRFAQLSHEYLIEQVQFTGDEGVGNTDRVKLNFNHPVKELIWVVQRDASVPYDWTTYSSAPGNEGINNVKDAKLQLNGQDRFATRAGGYFNLVQPFQHHENVSTNKGINVYSFALKPEEHQPSGTLNFSRIDTAVLQVNLAPTVGASTNMAKVKTFATNYNVLRIMSGMGGLAYSN